MREDADAGRNGDLVAALTVVGEDRLAELHQHVAPFERGGGVRKRLELREGGGHVLVPEADILVGRRPQGAGVTRGQSVGLRVVDDDLQILLRQLDRVRLRGTLEVVAAAEVEHDPAVGEAGRPGQKGNGRKHKDSGTHCLYRFPGP